MSTYTRYLSIKSFKIFISDFNIPGIMIKVFLVYVDNKYFVLFYFILFYLLVTVQDKHKT